MFVRMSYLMTISCSNRYHLVAKYKLTACNIIPF